MNSPGTPASGPVVANAGGTLTVSLLDGFAPEAGDTFVFFDAAGGQTGAFDEIVFSDSGYAGDFDYATGTLTIAAVPEPATYGLLAAGMPAALAFVRRRRLRFPAVCRTRACAW